MDLISNLSFSNLPELVILGKLFSFSLPLFLCHKAYLAVVKIERLCIQMDSDQIFYDIRSLTNNVYSNQPRVIRTWSIIASCPIFLPVSKSGTLESQIYALHKSLLLINPLPASPCQWPPIRAYQKPSFLSFSLFYSKTFSFFCLPLSFCQMQLTWLE